MEFIMWCVRRRTTWWFQRVQERRGDGRVNNWILDTVRLCSALCCKRGAMHAILTIRALFVGQEFASLACMYVCGKEHVSWGVWTCLESSWRGRELVMLCNCMWCKTMWCTYVIPKYPMANISTDQSVFTPLSWKTWSLQRQTSCWRTVVCFGLLNGDDFIF